MSDAALHVLALPPAAVAVLGGVRRTRGRARAASVLAGVVMLTSMADAAAGAVLPGPWGPLGWTAALLAAGTALAWAGRPPLPTTAGAAPGGRAPSDGAAHLLHVTCLPVMAALTATMGPHGAAVPHDGAHQHGDALAVVAFLAAAVHVAASCAVGVRPGCDHAARAEALAGGAAVAAMAGAAFL